MTATQLLSQLFVVVGCGFFFAGTVGLLRFPDSMTRLHALTKADNVGLGFICLGLALQDGSLAGIGKLLMVWFFALLSAAGSAFLIAGWLTDRQEDV